MERTDYKARFEAQMKSYADIMKSDTFKLEPGAKPLNKFQKLKTHLLQSQVVKTPVETPVTPDETSAPPLQS